jgi:predicted XRE-type DNA-binding protein
MTKIVVKKKKTQTRAKKQNHASVADMIREVLDDDEIADNFERHVNQRQIVKKLMALRAAAQISQQEIAAKLECTQSKVSKLENNKDEDLRLGDLAQYARALGYDMKIVLTPVNWQNGPFSIELKASIAEAIPTVS